MGVDALAAAAGRFREAVGGTRRLLAALLAGLAVLAGLSAVSPGRPAGRAIWVAARDLPGGAPLRAADLVVRRVPLALVPRGAMRAEATVLGRMLAAPMREGEPVTDVRLLEPSLLSALGRPGLVAVPVRLTDGAAAAAVLHPGDVVDVLSVGSEAGPDPSDPSASDPAAPAARVVADSVTVLSVPAAARLDGNDGGGLVVVAATATQAATLARAAVTTRLSVALRR